MLNLDLWFRLQLWQGPGAASSYVSMPVSLSYAGLSAIGLTEFQGASLCILSLNIVLGILLILVYEIGSGRKHCLVRTGDHGHRIDPKAISL